MNDYDRWCPDCQGWVHENELQVPVDGKPRHKLCGTVTLATRPVHVLDEAPTGPLTPGQVPCRVCQLNDRTRAASDLNDLLCNVCREDTPNREAKARRDALAGAIEKFFGIEPNTPLEETAAGSAELDLWKERVDTLMRLADLTAGHPLPYQLVNAAELGIKEMELQAHPSRFVLRAEAVNPQPTVAELQKQVEELQAQIEKRDVDARNHAFVEKSLDRLKPQLARRIADVICPPTEVSEDTSDEWLTARQRAVAAAERLVEEGLRFVPTTPEMEADERELRFVITATVDQDFMPTWDGELFDRPNAAGLQNDLTAVRERINRAGNRAPEAATWAAFALMRVPDELVFGTPQPETDHG